MAGNFTAARAFIYVAGNVIVAFQNNTNENAIYNQHNAAFNAVTGHQHTGAVGDAPPIGPSGIDLTANYNWTGTHSWLDDKLTIKNPAATFSYIFSTSAIVANRTVTLPLLNANDEFTMNGASQTLTNKTIPTHIAITNAGNNVTDPVGAQDVVTVAYANANYVPSGGGGIFIKADGTVAFTGDQSMGNHKLSNVATAAADGDAVNRKYLTDNNQNNKSNPTNNQDFVTRKYLTDNNQNNKTDPAAAQDFATKNYVDSQLLTQVYDSGYIAYKAVGNLYLNNVAHGLGGEPHLQTVYLKCVAGPEAGFAIGDVILWQAGDTVTARGFGTKVTSTHVTVIAGNEIELTRMDNGQPRLITIANWQARFVFFRFPT